MTTTATTTATPRRHHRHHALAELDRLIGRAEEARARCLADVPAAAAGGGAARAEVFLGLAEERLAELRRSRAALLADEER